MAGTQRLTKIDRRAQRGGSLAAADAANETEHDHGFGDHVFRDDRFVVEQAAFGSLVSLGYLDVGQSKATQVPWEIHRLMITQVGRLVIGAIEQVRAGFTDNRQASL